MYANVCVGGARCMHRTVPYFACTLARNQPQPNNLLAIYHYHLHGSLPPSPRERIAPLLALALVVLATLPALRAILPSVALIYRSKRVQGGAGITCE